jgi:hypothetical protein
VNIDDEDDADDKPERKKMTLGRAVIGERHKLGGRGNCLANAWAVGD